MVVSAMVFTVLAKYDRSRTKVTPRTGVVQVESYRKVTAGSPVSADRHAGPGGSVEE
jgi:hypothetical protein